jgi:competence protein ComEC
VGDAILLRSSEGKTALIDAGYPNRLALEYLVANNVTHIDMVIISHPHDDHIGGLLDVLGTIPVDLIVSNGEQLHSPINNALEARIQSTGVKTRVVQGGDQIPFGSLVFDVLSPVVISPEDANLNSLVLRLPVGQVAFLFTGDTYRQEELRLVAAGKNVQADILKLAHHGAHTSNDPKFIARVAPSTAIYSVGTGNTYGFPHPSTLETLNAAGVEVFGTDVYGTIVITTDGKTYQIFPEHTRID